MPIGVQFIRESSSCTGREAKGSKSAETTDGSGPEEKHVMEALEAFAEYDR